MPAPVPPPAPGKSTTEFLLAGLIVLVGAGAMVLGLAQHDASLQAVGAGLLVKVGGGYVAARTALKFLPQLSTWLGFGRMAIPFLPSGAQATANVVLTDVQAVLDALVYAQQSPSGAPLPPGADKAAAALKAAVAAPVPQSVGAV
jgi:hypothetical protein